MRLIDADKLPYEDVESVDGNTYMCVNAYDIEHAPTIERSEDCISRDDAFRIAEQGQIQGYEWQFKKLCNLPSVTPIRENDLDEKMKEYKLGFQDGYVTGNKQSSVQPTRLPGHWITNSDYPDKLICSECNSKFDMWWMDKGSNYCPNCGTKMGSEVSE